MAAMSLLRLFPASGIQVKQAGWRERPHLSLERMWQVASIPASGLGARGLGSKRSQRDWAMADGSPSLTLTWS